MNDKIDWDEEETPKHLGLNKTDYQFSKPSADLLDTFKNKHPYSLYLVPFTQDRDEFTSLCPVTNQPDHAKMEIIYVPNELMVESKSLKLYLFSFRNNGEFHEDVANRIASDLMKLLKAKYVRVFADFAPRGGIAIKPLVERWNTNDHSESDHVDRLVKSWDIKRG
ncbi:MAG: preQ(1) synthase [Deltaproteobacteria bacterium]|nr:preQ(1) synthase [Deltaproteobacteria bacterium]